jgi:hypothetical protein
MVADRAGGCCEYCRCQERFATGRFSVEHIKPRALGGKTHLSNLALACQACNNAKFTKQFAPDPLTGELVPLYNPRKYRWGDHFDWSVDGSHIVGVSPTGRATVESLDLNRESVVNLRRIQVLLGLHPPPDPR